MKTTLTKGTGSNYLVTVSVSTEDLEAHHKNAVQSFQGDVKVQWFRQGHVPLHIVEKQIKPEYLEMAIVEEIINDSIKYILKEHADIQFIGQPYEINEGTKDDQWRSLTYKLDVYPDIEVKDNKWEKLTIDPIDTTIGKDEAEKAIENLQRQYAEYKDADEIAADSLIKATYSMVDKDGKELHKGTAFVGKEEFEESTLLLDGLKGKKKGEVAEIAYEEEKLPHAVHYHPHGSEIAKQITKVILTIVDIKETILPDVHDEAVLTKLFQSPDIKTYKNLMDKVKSVLIEQKEEMELQTAVEKLLTEAKKSLTLDVPETFIREELNARVKQLADRMGWEEGLQQYLTQLWDEKTQKMYDEMKASAKESLEKFFILRKLIELFGIENVNWENPLDAERKLYGKLSTGATPKEDKKEDKKETKKTTKK